RLVDRQLRQGDRGRPRAACRGAHDGSRPDRRDEAREGHRASARRQAASRLTRLQSEKAGAARRARQSQTAAKGAGSRQRADALLQRAPRHIAAGGDAGEPDWKLFSVQARLKPWATNPTSTSGRGSRPTRCEDARPTSSTGTIWRRRLSPWEPATRTRSNRDWKT